MYIYIYIYIDTNRECIHPRIPQLTILGYPDSASVLYMTEVKSIWLAHFLAGKFKLPPVKEMEDHVTNWKKCIKRFAGDGYKRSCVSVENVLCFFW